MEDPVAWTQYLLLHRLLVWRRRVVQIPPSRRARLDWARQMAH
jgi:hypothetical protein